MVLSVTTVLVATPILVAPNMPCSLPKAPAIIFNDIQLHANGRIIALDIAVTRGWATLRRDGIKVVIDTGLSTANIHVKFNVSTKQIP